ncbi:hypothetical protein [Synechococcus sp. UW140]|uniref:hypothetical protein n=1 Tax=Synechococcus sp. UW140 TaxID=368503 RepID=UPI003137A929
MPHLHTLKAKTHQCDVLACSMIRSGQGLRKLASSQPLPFAAVMGCAHHIYFNGY